MVRRSDSGRPPRGGRAATLACVPAALLALAGAAAACDVCAVYTATETSERRPGFRLGLAEQYTDFATLRRDGEKVPNPANQWLASSITQVLLGYTFGPRLSLQLNLPLIVRDFRRPESGHIQHGSESGVGDLSLLTQVLVASHVTEQSVFRFSVLGGLKLPSGSSARIAEELEEGHTHGAALHVHGAVPQHAAHEPEPQPQQATGVESGIHGHDLALGSGSVDGLVGGQMFWSWKRLFVTAAGQYALRTEGDFGYTYADELTWATGPGAYALLRHDFTLGVQALFSGETKGKDDLNGVPADDTGITQLFVGPSFLFTWGTALAADFGADLPVVQHNTALQAVPDFRLHGGLTWRF